MAKIPGEPRINQYSAAQDQTTFTYTFLIRYEDEILVQKGQEVLSLNDDYTVTDVGVETGGTVILSVPSQEDDLITLTGNTIVQRVTTFIDDGPFSAKSVNDEYNLIDDMMSEVITDHSRYVQQDPVDLSVSMTLPTPESTKGLKWSSDGKSIVNTSYDPDESVERAVAAAEEAEFWASTVDLQDLNSDIIPNALDVWDLGKVDKRWKTVHAYQVHALEYYRDGVQLGAGSAVCTIGRTYGTPLPLPAVTLPGFVKREFNTLQSSYVISPTFDNGDVVINGSPGYYRVSIELPHWQLNNAVLKVTRSITGFPDVVYYGVKFSGGDHIHVATLFFDALVPPAATFRISCETHLDGFTDNGHNLGDPRGIDSGKPEEYGQMAIEYLVF